MEYLLLPLFILILIIAIAVGILRWVLRINDICRYLKEIRLELRAARAAQPSTPEQPIPKPATPEQPIPKPATPEQPIPKPATPPAAPKPKPAKKTNTDQLPSHCRKP